MGALLRCEWFCLLWMFLLSWWWCFEVCCFYVVSGLVVALRFVCAWCGGYGFDFVSRVWFTCFLLLFELGLVDCW